jgi:hypothetical protein
MKHFLRIAVALASTLLGCLSAQERISLDGVWSSRSEPLDDANPAPHETNVPAAFETVYGPQFDGVVRYRRTLPLPKKPPPKERVETVRLEFAAVATHATVFCNGIPVGTHLGGWTPFRCDITQALKWDGNDAIEVRVDEKVGHNTQGFLPIVQPHFGGVWQSVTLCVDRGPVLDRLGVFLFGDAAGKLQFSIPVLGALPGKTTAEISVLDGSTVLSRTNVTLTDDTPFAGSLEFAAIEPWSPTNPRLYTARFALLDGNRELDHYERRVGFRTLTTNGMQLLWNGEPLQMRGVLHWGYSPPNLAPPTDPAFWRRQLQDFKSLGFNCIKCCLWVPPACVYDLADELGLLVWQEYPTWHPQMDQAHKQELLTEYGEFFVHDRSHPSTAFRSITCETGHSADFDVVKALFEACKAAVPQTLVVDDSSWIGWQRITDFWDEHPYGNNSWFPGRLDEFKTYIEEKGQKPLLLGECIAADTWFDRAAWNASHGKEPLWWRPTCWESQGPAEAWLTKEFGAETVASLLPLSLDFGLQNRKFQIEQLRMNLPDAGYVVSVARDIPKCRMGLYDERDQLKWSAEQWSWQADTMLCLDQPWNGRALEALDPKVTVRISHYGKGPLHGELHLWSDALQRDELRVPLDLQPGTVSAPFILPLAGMPENLTRVRIHAELTGSHPAQNQWDVWRVPVWSYPGNLGVRIVKTLTPELLTELENGATVLLQAGDQKGSLRTEGMWFLKGAPFAPPHPIHARIPRDLLLDLCSFDLETGRVMPWELLKDQVDPILGFWETHDIPEVRFHLYAFDCRVGKGRLLATTLNLDSPVHSLGFHVQYLLEDHLAHGRAPQRELSATTIAALRASLTEKKLDLPIWRFRTDPKNEGRTANWHDPMTNVQGADWRDLKAGSHWENQADDLKQYTGVAWYRVDVTIPADWKDHDVKAVFEGVDDSFEFWLNGEPAGTFGDEATKKSIWLERQVADLGRRLRPGETNTLVLRVVDHAGAGGLWKPVFLTTGPTDDLSRLLH